MTHFSLHTIFWYLKTIEDYDDFHEILCCPIKSKTGKYIVYVDLHNKHTEELAEFCFIFQNILFGTLVPVKLNFVVALFSSFRTSNYSCIKCSFFVFEQFVSFYGNSYCWCPEISDRIREAFTGKYTLNYLDFAK